MVNIAKAVWAINQANKHFDDLIPSPDYYKTYKDYDGKAFDHYLSKTMQYVDYFNPKD